MPVVSRTMWLTSPYRIMREDDNVVFVSHEGKKTHAPITDIDSIICFFPVDINTSCVSLLGKYNIEVHLIDYYGNYAGYLASDSRSMASARCLKAQVEKFSGDEGLALARQVTKATAYNVSWALDKTSELKSAQDHLAVGLGQAQDTAAIMGYEGSYRRSAWGLLDTMLPEWLQLQGRSIRPPKNQGNAFISYANSIIYAKMTSAIRSTPLSPSLGFLHSDMDRRRNTLALDMAELFKPLFSERILKRAAQERVLAQSDFNPIVGGASFSPNGLKKISTLLRDEMQEKTVFHRNLKRRVSYQELMYLEALKLSRSLLENEPYKPFRPWW